MYGDAFDDQDLIYQPNINDGPSFWGNLSFAQLCSQCILPAIWSTCNLLGTTLVLCIFFRVFIVIREYIGTRFIKIIIQPILKQSLISGNKFNIVPEAILHLVCAICGILPIILFHENGDLYQLLLQIVLFPMFCYLVSIICILILKSHSAIVFSAIILFTLFYR